MAKKIRIEENGKKFEAFLKLAMTTIDVTGRKVLIGVAYAGTSTACRAIHAALYDHEVEIYNEETGRTERIRSSRSFKRIEEVNENVCHVFCMPRMALNEEYREEVSKLASQENPPMPERIIMTWNQDVKEVAGHFLSDTFGLPRSKEWKKHYLNLLPNDKVEKVTIETTSLAGELSNIEAYVIKSMKEEEVLSYIQIGMKNGILQTKSEGIQIKSTFEEDWSTEEYLRANAEHIFTKIDTYMKPLYDGTVYNRYIAETNRLSVPAQARSVMGLLAVLKKSQGGFLSATMGSGKSQMSLTAAYIKARQREDSGAKDGFRSLLVAPSNVLPKWATSEIPKALGPTCIIEASQLAHLDSLEHSNIYKDRKLFADYHKSKNIATILNSTEDALIYIQLIKSGFRIPKGKIHFILVSTDRMKLGAFGYTLGAKWNPYRFQWISPNTGKALQSPSEKIADRKSGVLAEWKDVVLNPPVPPTMELIKEAREKGEIDPHGLPISYVKKWQPQVRAFQDDYTAEKKHCSLARPALKKYGESKNGQRWMIAQLLQRKLSKHFHLAIIDEVHQLKGQGSGRGLSFHKLIKSCRKVIMLTGTLTNGESSSIQAVLWRVFPRELMEAGFTHKTSSDSWARRYGVLEQVRKIEEEFTEVGITTNRRNEVIVKEKPGISPELVANHLLDKTVFMDVSDLQVPMITLDEVPIVIPLDEDHKDEYSKFHSAMYDTAMNLQKELGSAAWSKFTPAVLNYADQPSLKTQVEFINREGEILAHVTAPSFPKDYETAKERKLIELVKSRLKDQRRVIIYTHYTQDYQTNQRIQHVLAENGVDSTILDSKISTSQRFDWLEKQAEIGTKVIITNQTLVEVGLDLLDFPTIIFFQMNDNINTVRQSSKRAHRLGQHRHCEIFYLVNEQTQQMVQFQRLMSRRVAALLVEGAIERSDEIAKYADISNAGLTKDLCEMLESSEIVNAWEQAAQKDMDSNLEMVTEEEFQEKITEAFARLTQETKQLCGYVEPIILENRQENVMEEETIGSIFEYENAPVTELDPKPVVSSEKKISSQEPVGFNNIFEYLEKVQEEEQPKTIFDLFAKKGGASSKTDKRKKDVYEGTTLFDFLAM